MQEIGPTRDQISTSELDSQGTRKVVLLLKRVFDIALACFSLVLVAPLMLVIAIVIRLDSPGPICYRQLRVGLNGSLFEMFMFRTMFVRTVGETGFLNNLRTQPAENTAKWSLRLDPRITRIGRWLRRTHLDELPQWWNVLKGDLSIVGPRPLLPFVDARSRALLAPECISKRLSVRPGITGLWQIQQRWDSTFEQMLQIDLKYVSQVSFWLDLKILIRTVGAALSLQIPPN